MIQARPQVIGARHLHGWRPNPPHLSHLVLTIVPLRPRQVISIRHDHKKEKTIIATPISNTPMGVIRNSDASLLTSRKPKKIGQSLIPGRDFFCSLSCMSGFLKNKKALSGPWVTLFGPDTWHFFNLFVVYSHRLMIYVCIFMIYCHIDIICCPK